MPNNITNLLTFQGDEETIKELLEVVKNDKLGTGTIDFEKIIPSPSCIYRGNLGPKEEIKYRGRNWYNWNIRHWGTKWNAYGFNEYKNKSENELKFNTAWSPPTPVIIELSRLYPDVKIVHRWCDECTFYEDGVGESVYENGKEVAFCRPESNDDVYEFAE